MPGGSANTLYDSTGAPIGVPSNPLAVSDSTAGAAATYDVAGALVLILAELRKITYILSATYEIDADDIDLGISAL